ncbi:hypothetical protein [Caulobacter sp. Root343]|uniref:hypothetical protein n=1 Tax=Caulobacter sp. Root343 TaxID=1736520 RepID=UPI0012E3360F|nr:hypothetical protein [Caulobacter sp. Root343]
MTQVLPNRPAQGWLSSCKAWPHWSECFCAAATVAAALLAPALVLVRLWAVSHH